MVESDENQIGRFLRLILAPVRKYPSRTGCLDEERLAVYLSGNLAEGQKREVESHLAACALCLGELVGAYTAEKTGDDESLPRPVVERAMALMHRTSPEPDFLELVVRLAKDSLALVTTSGELVLANAPGVIRGKGISPAGGSVQVAKDLGNFRVTVEVERTEGELCQVSVTVTPTAGSFADGLRISLLSGEREQASYLARHGTAVFDRIASGAYQLAVFDRGSSLGAISLKIKEDSRER